MSAVQPMVDLSHSDDPQRETKEFVTLWRNATPEAQWEALRILRAATNPRQERAVKP